MGVSFGPEVGEGSNPSCLISHADSAQFLEAVLLMLHVTVSSFRVMQVEQEK